MDARFERGVRLFDEGAWFEAHEEWEACWRDARADEDRLFFQALVQVAAALHKLFVMHDAASAERILSRAYAKLESMPASKEGIDVARLRDELRRCLDAIAREGLGRGEAPRLR